MSLVEKQNVSTANKLQYLMCKLTDMVGVSLFIILLTNNMTFLRPEAV